MVCKADMKALAFIPICAVVTLAVVAEVAPPPFTYSLDQATPCPRDVNDAWYTQSDGLPEPVSPNETDALAAAVANIPSLLDKYRKKLNAPSVGFIATQNGQVFAEGYSGTQRIGQSVPVQRSSRYRIASNTKLFTSAMMFQLRDRGLLPQGLDTEVAAILPGFQEPKRPAAWRSRRGITLRALATHSSGLIREALSGYSTDEKGHLYGIGNSTVLFPMYASTHYSNIGIQLLGRALEKVAGKSWERWIQEDLLDPLDMRNSGPCLRTQEEADALVDGVNPSTGEKVHTDIGCAWTSPSGRMFSSNGDMATWVSFLSGQLQRSDILDAATLYEMRNMVMLQSDGSSGVSASTFEAAFSHNRWTFNKLGCVDGYRSDTTVVPDLGLGVVAYAASTCDTFGDGDAVAFPVLSQLIPALEQALKQRFQRSAVAHPGADDYAGLYCSSNITQAMQVSLNAAGELVITKNGPGGYEWTLLQVVDESSNTFRMMMIGDAGTKFLPSSTLGCQDVDGPWPQANLCPVSCFREMARGDVELMVFDRNEDGKVSRVRIPGMGYSCSKHDGVSDLTVVSI